MELRRGEPSWDLKRALGTVVECWPDNLVLNCSSSFLVARCCQPNFGWFGSGSSSRAWRTVRQLLPRRHLWTCVIQCLLALPDRAETRQRAVFLQPCDDQPCDQRVPLPHHPEGICINSPNVGLDARGLRWPIRARLLREPGWRPRGPLVEHWASQESPEGKPRHSHH